MNGKQFYLYDTHCHTAESSKCGRGSAEDMVAEYVRSGYAGIIVTDHFLNGNTTAPADLPWEERIERLFLGYETAKAAGDRLGLDVFYGFEYSIEGNDFLTYGISRDWLIAHPEVMEWSLNHYLHAVRDDGGFVVHAHPFRQAAYIRMIRLLPDLVDAVEIYNGQRPEKVNLRARWYAESYGLPVTAGSDSHSPDMIRGSGVLSETRFRSVSDYVQAVRDGKLQILPHSRPEDPAS